MLCYMIYNSIPSKYAKLEERFDGFIKRSLIRFEYEKSPLHTIVYGGTGTGKTNFVRQLEVTPRLLEVTPRPRSTSRSSSTPRSRSKSKSKSR